MKSQLIGKAPDAGKVKSLVSNMLSRLVIAFLEIEATATMFKRRLSFRGGACCQR